MHPSGLGLLVFQALCQASLGHCILGEQLAKVHVYGVL